MKSNNTILTLLIIGIVGVLYACTDDMESPQLNGDFSADKLEVTAGEAVTFTDASTGNPSRWNWTFEGGTPASSVLSGPTIIYETPGTYSVKLMIGRAGDSTITIKDEYITVGYGEVTADFSANNTSILQGESVTFTDLSEGIPTSWAWEFIPDGGGETITSTDQNPIVVFPEPGSYTVKLNASNPVSGSELIKPGLITVIDPAYLEADFTAIFKGTYTGGSVSFQDVSLGTATQWSWTFEGGTPATSTEQNPNVTYSAPGRYRVTLVASNDVKSSTIEKDNYVLVVPGTDLAAFYPLDDNANDAGPNGIDPNNLGNVVFTGTDRNAVGNNTAVFDGASGLIVPDNAALNHGTSNFTVSLWVKTDQTSKMMIWQESGSGGPGDKQSWLRIGDNTTSRLVRFAVEDSNGGAIINVGDGDLAGGVSDNSWHHVVCVREGTITSVYVDGVFVKSLDNTPARDVSSEQALKIGLQETSPGMYGNYFTGSLDDIVIYNRALTAAEVGELFGL